MHKQTYSDNCVQYQTTESFSLEQTEPLSSAVGEKTFPRSAPTTPDWLSSLVVRGCVGKRRV